jgi:hypothetical protein
MTIATACAISWGCAPPATPAPDPGYLVSHTGVLQTGLTLADPIGAGVNGIPFGAMDLSLIAATVQVVGLPGLGPIEGDVLTEQPSTSSGVITFLPATGLVEGWYRLSVNLGELDRYAAPGFDADPEREDTYTTDFRIGSLPLLMVECSFEEATGVSVVLIVTEPVRPAVDGLEIDDVLSFAVNDVPVDCSPAPSALPPDVWRDLEHRRRATFFCPSSARPANVTISVAPGIVSIADGSPLRDLDGDQDIVLPLALGELGYAQSPTRVTDAVVGLASGPIE